MECNCKSATPIRGISCSVSNCEFHGGKSECLASEVNVCCCDPTQQCSVECKTFRPKTGR